MVKILIPKNQDLIEIDKETIKVTIADNDAFEIIESKNLIFLKYEKVFGNVLTLIFEISNEIEKKLGNKYRLFALITFSKTRYRKSIEISPTSKNQIELKNADVAGDGQIKFTITDINLIREYNLSQNWRIRTENGKVTSDFRMEWISFDDEKYNDYDEVLLDVYADETNPIIYVNKDITGLYDLLFNMDLPKKKRVLQNIISKIITSYVLLACAIYDLIFIELNYKKNDIDSDFDGFTMDDLSKVQIRRIMLFFKTSQYPDQNHSDIVESIKKLLENNDPTTVSEIILGIQQSESLKTSIEELIGVI